MRLIGFPREVPGPVNLGNPREITIAELVERVRVMTGSRSRIAHKPLPADDPKRRCPDIALSMRLLDWSPKVPLEIGLARTVRWLKSREIGQASRPRRRAPERVRTHVPHAAEDAGHSLRQPPRPAADTASPFRPQANRPVHSP